MRGICAFLIAAAASALETSAAVAQTPDVRLEWERPVGSLCPSRNVLEADVEQIMDRPIFTSSASDARVIVRGVIRETSLDVRVRIEAHGAEGALLGMRELQAPAGQCASLRSPIALVLTLFVERDALSAEADGPTFRFGWGAAAAAASTPLPRTTFTVGPSLSLEIGRYLRLHAAGAYWVPVSIETRRGVGAQLEAFSFALRACARLWGETRFGLRLCLGGELGALIASPLRLDGPEHQTRLLAHGLLDLRWETRLGRAAMLDFAVGPLLSFSRPSFSYTRRDGEDMPVYRPALTGILFQVTFIILSS